MIRELRLDANGLSFRALAAGPESGPPMLLLHGFPEGAEEWADQLEALDSAGVRAVAPDLRGYGGTDAPAGVERYTLAALVEDVAALAASMGGGPVHLAGHDWGALTGWSAVTARPQLFRTWTAISIPHLADLAAAIATDDDQKARSSYVQLFMVAGKAESVLSEDGFRRLAAMYGGKLPAARVERYLEGLRRPGRLTAALNYYRANLQGGSGGSDGPVRVPTVMVWGDHDLAAGRVAVEATERRVQAPYRLVVLEGAGHWLPAERAAEVSEVLVQQATSG